MKRALTTLAALAVILAALAAPLRAQVIGGLVRFGVAGGATVPTGDLNDVSNVGWHAGALVDLGFPLVALGFRIDGMWHQLGSESVTIGPASAEFETRIIAVALNGTYTFGLEAPAHFYLIGGLGVYNLRTKVEVTNRTTDAVSSSSDSETKFGLNAGAGVRFPLLDRSAFVEARWHNIFSAGPEDSAGNRGSARMVPISVGVTF
jgi:opacity protein-like surface antigen